MERIKQVAWVLDHLDDLDADFRAIYHIQDMYALDGPRFFKLAYRLPAYEGVMRARMQEQQEEAKRRTPGARHAAKSGQPVRQASIHDPAIADYFEVGTA